MTRPYKIVLSEKLSEPFDQRYVVVDAATGEVLDDANGYGYTSAQKAHIAYGYKTRDKGKDDEKRQRRLMVKRWAMEHDEFIKALDWNMKLINRGEGEPGVKFDTAYVRDALRAAGYRNLPFTANELYKFMTT